MRPSERGRVAVLSAAFTYLLFLEYLPPLQRFHLPFDIEGFHYPLLDYAFQALGQGRFPEWDAAIYCGLSFAGNIQAGLFYPPNWVLFAVNMGRESLSYLSLEMLALAHLWLAFFLCYVWLRGRRIGPVAAALGAGVFAYSGYSMSQLQHLGVIGAYAWFPLGLRGIDQAADQRDWRPLWKVVAASVLAFLAGYPATWMVFCVCALAYGVAIRRRTALGVAGALAVSLLVGMVQLIPAWEAASAKAPGARYGTGIRDYQLYWSYLLPNYFDTRREASGERDPTVEYFYLGAPAWLAMGWAARRGFRGQRAALAIAGVSFMLVSNPMNLVGASVGKLPVLPEIVRDFNFLAGLTLAATLLTAVSLNDFLERPGRRLPAPRAAVWIALAAIWSARQVWVWLPGGANFGAGWRAAFEPAILLALVAIGLGLLRSAEGRGRVAVVIALLAAVGIDYKVFGTSKRFNAHLLGDMEFAHDRRTAGFAEIVGELRSQPEFRVAVDDAVFYPLALRHVGLGTPQGFDPLLPAAYQQVIQARAVFDTDRTFSIDPRNQALLARLGVRYYWTNDGPMARELAVHPDYRRVGPPGSYFQVFEWRGASPAYRWDGEARVIAWAPERRELVVRSAAGGSFALVEQFFPGWRASVDDRPAPIERWEGAFQAIAVPAGEHRVRFEFQSRGLRLGAAVSLLSLIAVWIAARRRPAAGSRQPPGR